MSGVSSSQSLMQSTHQANYPLKFNSRVFISSEMRRFQGKADRNGGLTLTNEDILLLSSSNKITYTTGLKVCMADVLDKETFELALQGTEFKYCQGLLRELKGTVIWPGLVNMMVIPLYREMGVTILSSWRDRKNMFDFLSLMVTDATTQLLRREILVHESLYKGAGLDAQRVLGDANSITLAMSCDTGRVMVSTLGFKDSYHFWAWMSKRDSACLSILGDEEWSFGRMMAMPLEFNLYNEQSTIRRLLELSKLIMSQLWLFLTFDEMPIEATSHVPWSENLKKIQDSSIKDPVLARTQIFAYILRHHKKLLSLQESFVKLQLTQLQASKYGLSDILKLLPPYNYRSAWDKLLTFCEERGFMRHWVLWDLYLDGEKKHATWESTREPISAEAPYQPLEPSNNASVGIQKSTQTHLTKRREGSSLKSVTNVRLKLICRDPGEKETVAANSNQTGRVLWAKPQPALHISTAQALQCIPANRNTSPSGHHLDQEPTNSSYAVKASGPVSMTPTGAKETPARASYYANIEKMEQMSATIKKMGEGIDKIIAMCDEYLKD